MHTRNLLLIKMAALALSAAPAAAQDFTWRERVAAGQWLEIKGVIGSVRATASSGDRVEVEATRTARRSDPEDVEIVVHRHARGVTICALYPQGRNRQPNECLPDDRGRMNSQNNDVKVDFVVRVPRSVHFAGRTVLGDVTITSLSGDVRAQTVNGNIRVSTAGLAEASTVNGSIDVAMGRADWSETLEFETVNGAIRLELPDRVDTDVSASTVNGSIDSDFPLTVRGRFSGKRLSGTIGRGGRDLTLGTVNGDIEIRRR
jgi:putative adhesin